MTTQDADQSRAGRTLISALGGSPSAILGLTICALFTLLSIGAPLIAPFDPQALGAHRLVAPGWQHLMGTDDLGRDVFSRVLYAGRVSLFVGIITALISSIIGGVMGIVAGYMSGTVDEVVMRITEYFQIIPKFLLAIVAVAVLGGGYVLVIAVISLLSWPNVARVVRSQALVLRKEEFILAAQMAGSSQVRTLIRQVLPNVLPFIVVAGSLQTGQAILIESFLSFLGLGDPLNPSWGLLLQQAQIYLATAWWMSVFPGTALALTIVGLNLAGDGLGEAINPRHRSA